MTIQYDTVRSSYGKTIILTYLCAKNNNHIPPNYQAIECQFTDIIQVLRANKALDATNANPPLSERQQHETRRSEEIRDKDASSSIAIRS